MMKPFRSILYVSESNVMQDNALLRAVTLAERHGASLTVVEVVSLPRLINLPAGLDTHQLLNTLIEHHHQQLAETVAPFQARVPIDVQVLSGKRFLEVIRQVLRYQHDLVIKAAEDPDWVARLFGSDDMHLLRKCPCPVWLIKASDPLHYQNVMAAIDVDVFDTSSEEHQLNQLILDHATSVAAEDAAQCHLVHAWQAPDAGLVALWAEDPAAEQVFIESERQRHHQEVARCLEQWQAQNDIHAQRASSMKRHFPFGNPVTMIPALAKQLDVELVVMGTLARTGVPGLVIGNTAEAVLDQLHCSVLAIKPPGFVSPVSLEE